MPRSVILAALLATMAVWTSAPALAHVTAEIDHGARGGYGLITLRVPNESDTASTTKLQVRVPDDAGLASVLVKPTPGWRATVTKKKVPSITEHGTQVSETVDTVTWVATGSGIAPGEFDQFFILAGPLPDAEQLALPAVQTYSDGTEVAWTQQASGGAEPERPAPTVTLAAATPNPAPLPAPIPWIAWAALGLSVLAVVLGGLGLVRSR
jgi:uncharacterized protein YcnI